MTLPRFQLESGQSKRVFRRLRRDFSRSKAVPQRMTRRSAWLQFLQKFKTERSSRSSDNPSFAGRNLGCPAGIRAVAIDFAPVPIGIGAMQTRFWLPLRAFSRSKAVPQRMTQPSAWLRKQKPPTKAAGCNSCKSSKQSRPQNVVTTPICYRSQLGLWHNPSCSLWIGCNS